MDMAKYSFALLALSSFSSARDIVFPPVAAVHPSGQFPLGRHDDVDITSGSQFSGLTTFAHIPYVNCFVEESGDHSYDIAILGAPFDTVSHASTMNTQYAILNVKGVTARPGARYGPGGIRLGSRRLGGWNIYTGENVFESWAKLVDCGDAPLTWLDNTVALKQLDLAHKVFGLLCCGFRD